MSTNKWAEHEGGVPSDKLFAAIKEICTDTATQKYRRYLNQWEVDFVETLAGRIDKYGSKAFISKKQAEVLGKIELKMYNPDPSTKTSHYGQ